MTVKLLPILAVVCMFTAPPHAGDTTITTADPARAEIVTSDVAHFWTAFDDAARQPMAERAGVYALQLYNGIVELRASVYSSSAARTRR
jgi:hypothetical protein